MSTKAPSTHASAGDRHRLDPRFAQRQREAGALGYTMLPIYSKSMPEHPNQPKESKRHDTSPGLGFRVLAKGEKTRSVKLQDAELEKMKQAVELDLPLRTRVTVRSEGQCGVCGRQIMGRSRAGADGTLYHEECFKCDYCSFDIDGEEVVRIENEDTGHVALYHPGHCADHVMERLCRACGEFIQDDEEICVGHDSDVFHKRCFKCSCCSVPFSREEPFFTPPDFTVWRPKFVHHKDLPKPHPYMCEGCEDREHAFQQRFKRQHVASMSAEDKLRMEFGGDREPRVCDLTKKLPVLDGPAEDGTYKRRELLVVNKEFDIEVDPAAVTCKKCDLSLGEMADQDYARFKSQRHEILRDPMKHTERILHHQFLCANCESGLADDFLIAEDQAARTRSQIRQMEQEMQRAREAEELALQEAREAEEQARLRQRQEDEAKMQAMQAAWEDRRRSDEVRYAEERQRDEIALEERRRSEDAERLRLIDEREREEIERRKAALISLDGGDTDTLKARRNEIRRTLSELQKRDADREHKWFELHQRAEDKLLLQLERAPHILQSYVEAKRETHDFFQDKIHKLLEELQEKTSELYKAEMQKGHSVMYCDVEAEKLKWNVLEQQGLCQQQSRDAKDKLLEDYKEQIPPAGPPFELPGDDPKKIDHRMNVEHLIIEGDYVELAVAKKSYKYGTVFPIGSKAIVRKVLYNVPVRSGRRKRDTYGRDSKFDEEDEPFVLGGGALSEGRGVGSQKDLEKRLQHMRDERSERKKKLLASQRTIEEELKKTHTVRKSKRLSVPFRGEVTSKDATGTVIGEAEITLEELFDADIKEVYYEGTAPKRIKSVQRAYLLSFLPPGLDPRNPDSFNPFRAGFPEQYKGHGIFRDMEWYVGDGLYLDGGRLNKQFLTKHMWVKKLGIKKYESPLDRGGAQPLFRPIADKHAVKAYDNVMKGNPGLLELLQQIGEQMGPDDQVKPEEKAARLSEMMRFLIQPWQVGPVGLGQGVPNPQGPQGGARMKSVGFYDEDVDVPQPGDRERTLESSKYSVNLGMGSNLEVADYGEPRSSQASILRVPSQLEASRDGSMRRSASRATSASRAKTVIDELLEHSVPVNEMPEVLDAIEKAVAGNPALAVEIVEAVRATTGTENNDAPEHLRRTTRDHGTKPPSGAMKDENLAEEAVEAAILDIAADETGNNGASVPLAQQLEVPGSLVPESKLSEYARASEALTGALEEAMSGMSPPAATKLTQHQLSINLRHTAQGSQRHGGTGAGSMALRRGLTNQFEKQDSSLHLPGLRPTPSQMAESAASAVANRSLRPVTHLFRDTQQRETTPPGDGGLMEELTKKLTTLARGNSFDVSLRRVDTNKKETERISQSDNPFHNASPELRQRFSSLRPVTGESLRDKIQQTKTRTIAVAMLNSALRGIRSRKQGRSTAGREMVDGVPEHDSYGLVPNLRQGTQTGDVVFEGEGTEEAIKQSMRMTGHAGDRTIVTVRERVPTARGIRQGTVRNLASHYEDKQDGEFHATLVPRTTRSSGHPVSDASDVLEAFQPEDPSVGPSYPPTEGARDPTIVPGAGRSASKALSLARKSARKSMAAPPSTVEINAAIERLSEALLGEKQGIVNVYANQVDSYSDQVGQKSVQLPPSGGFGGDAADYPAPIAQEYEAPAAAAQEQGEYSYFAEVPQAAAGQRGSWTGYFKGPQLPWAPSGGNKGPAPVADNWAAAAPAGGEWAAVPAAGGGNRPGWSGYFKGPQLPWAGKGDWRGSAAQAEYQGGSASWGILGGGDRQSGYSTFGISPAAPAQQIDAVRTTDRVSGRFMASFCDGSRDVVETPAGVYEYAIANLWWRLTILENLEIWLNYGYVERDAYYEGECECSAKFLPNGVEFTIETVSANDEFRRQIGSRFIVSRNPDTGALLPDKARMLQMICM